MTTDEFISFAKIMRDMGATNVHHQDETGAWDVTFASPKPAGIDSAAALASLTQPFAANELPVPTEDELRAAEDAEYIP